MWTISGDWVTTSGKIRAPAGPNPGQLLSMNQSLRVGV